MSKNALPISVLNLKTDENNHADARVHRLNRFHMISFFLHLQFTYVRTEQCIDRKNVRNLFSYFASNH